MQSYLEGYFGKNKITSIEPLAQAGSDRKYVRVLVDEKSFIVCESSNIKENETFLYFSKFFKQHQIPVPEIVDISSDKSIYILEDVGSESLLDKIIQKGYTDSINAIYIKAISSLVQMQIIGGQQLDFSKCYAASSFDKNAVLADLNYFKYYFLDLQKIDYDKSKLHIEFEKLAAQIGNIEPRYFMFRDFQGRNIMIKDEQPFFIDYQGGMKGPLQYDVASLLWQAKAQLTSDWKQNLYTYYKNELKKHISFDEKYFDNNYSLIVLTRLLQVLGAYGLRGIIEKRQHFLSSIPLGLENIKEWQTQFSLHGYDELNIILIKLQEKIPKEEFPVSPTGRQIPNPTFTIEAKPELHRLKVIVQSFSYKKGMPADSSGNGGGYVFDCRGILNPGRFDDYKKLTGRDQPVIDFLETKTKIGDFLIHAKSIVDISMEDYLQRGFEHLMISFGCTGGQHRSVYCADAMSKYLKEKYNIEIITGHIEQEAKGWIN